MYETGSVAVVYASHVLEHASYNQHLLEQQQQQQEEKGSQKKKKLTGSIISLVGTLKEWHRVLANDGLSSKGGKEVRKTHIQKDNNCVLFYSFVIKVTPPPLPKLFFPPHK